LEAILSDDTLDLMKADYTAQPSLSSAHDSSATR
jgi:hypothetical protein